MAAEITEANLGSIVDLVAREKGIDKQILIDTLEAAILRAAQAAFGVNRELETRFNSGTGTVDLFQYMTVVDEVDLPEREIAEEDARRFGLDAAIGEELGFQVFWHPADAAKARQQDKEFGEILDMKQARSAFGRIAAQTAKQVLLQRVRDAERDLVYNEFKDKKGELIRGIVRRFAKGHNIIVDLGRTEGILPHREQTPRESYRPGDRIVAYVKNVDREAKGPMVILSRCSPHLVEKLFESEVPEIFEGIVRVVGVAREPGSRSKIAVASRDGDVDPVGACVGIKGSRVQAVVQELRGEKIDIVPFDPEIARYVISAIQPAEVNRVIVDPQDNRMELVVPDEKLSVAIGRRGQNVILASQLTGWKLDIISESKFKAIEEDALKAFREISEVTEDIARALYNQGFRALEELGEASIEELVAIEEIGATLAPVISEKAYAAMETLRHERVRDAIIKMAPLSDRELLRLIRGVGLRTLQLLEENGYRKLGDILQEDPDRLSIKTGLSNRKARSVLECAGEFVQHELPLMQQRREELFYAQQAEAAANAEAAATEGSSDTEADSAERDSGAEAADSNEQE